MYFDTDGLPTMDTHIKYGYRKEYDANEHLAAVICLDSAMDTYRKYGYRKEYDADGHVAAVICPDSDKNTMNDSEHYAIIKKTYYADGKLRIKVL